MQPVLFPSSWKIKPKEAVSSLPGWCFIRPKEDAVTVAWPLQRRKLLTSGPIVTALKGSFSDCFLFCGCLFFFVALLSGSEAETTGTLSSLYIVKSLLPSFPFETLLSPLKTHPNPILLLPDFGNIQTPLNSKLGSHRRAEFQHSPECSKQDEIQTPLLPLIPTWNFYSMYNA